MLLKEDACIVQRALEQKGLAVQTGTSVVQISGEGKVQRVTLGDGTVLPCDVVVVSTGVRPNLALAKSAGIAIGRGILVDEYLRTSARDVYAAGDVAEGWDLARGRQLPNPTWGNASEQGRVAAHNMAGHTKPFNGAVTVNTFTFLGFRMAAVGITQPEGDFCQVESYIDPKSGDYRKLIKLGDRLVGGITVGDVRMAGIWRGLIAKKGPDAPAALRAARRQDQLRLDPQPGPWRLTLPGCAATLLSRGPVPHLTGPRPVFFYRMLNCANLPWPVRPGAWIDTLEGVSGCS